MACLHRLLVGIAERFLLSRQARKQCTALLQLDLEHETATMILADIMFCSNEFDEARPPPRPPHPLLYPHRSSVVYISV